MCLPGTMIKAYYVEGRHNVAEPYAAMNEKISVDLNYVNSR